MSLREALWGAQKIQNFNLLKQPVKKINTSAVNSLILAEYSSI
jgi:hypothetical protein